MSIRLKLALWYVGFVVATVLGFGLLLHFLLAARVRSEVDVALQGRAGHVLELGEAGQPVAGVQATLPLLPDAITTQLAQPDIYHQFVNPSGMPEMSSANLRGRQLPVTPGVYEALRTGEEQFEDVRLQDGTRMRILIAPIVWQGQIEGVLQVASSVDVAEGAILPFHGYLLGGMAGVVAVALASGLYLTRKSMNPVKALTRTAEAIYQVGDLSRRIEVGKGGDEIKTLGRTFNRMLDSIEQLVTSQHRFLADASHELKTPLTVIRGNAEILCRGAASGADDEAADAILREATRMQRIVDDLLAIAELDAATEMRFEPVEVRALAERAVHDLEPLAGSRELWVRGDGEVLISGDVDRLERVVRNLVQNAIAATEPAGRIEVDVRRHNGMARLVVADDGRGIAPEHVPHIFDRFYRVDPSRSRATGGTGLGLTIVKRVAEAHGGSVEAGRSELGGAVFEVRLPADGHADPADDRANVRYHI